MALIYFCSSRGKIHSDSLYICGLLFGSRPIVISIYHRHTRCPITQELSTRAFNHRDTHETLADVQKKLPGLKGRQGRR